MIQQTTVMSPAGLETMNDCANEDQEQSTRPIDCRHDSVVVMILMLSLNSM
jgi:hypothetical protein